MAITVSSSILLGMQGNKSIYTSELLDTIARVESNNNYNAYYGNANNSEIQFTSMPVSEVLVWQRQFVEEGSPSSAVGRYQFIDSTLQGLVVQLDLDQNKIFDEALQDRLAMALLERRGLRDYVENKISREEFAHNLSKEWAALPKVIGENPSQSYYAGDGLNKARLSIEDIYASIDTLHEV